MAVDPATVDSLKTGESATVVPIVTTIAKAYTRGAGFTAGPGGNEPNDEIAAVIATASARLSQNPKGLSQQRIDDCEVQYSKLSSGFAWTLAEQIVLNRYRVRAQ